MNRDEPECLSQSIYVHNKFQPVSEDSREIIVNGDLARIIAAIKPKLSYRNSIGVNQASVTEHSAFSEHSVLLLSLSILFFPYKL